MGGDGVYVGLEGKGDDIGVEPVNDGTGLRARAAVRHADRDILPGTLLPVAGEGRIHLAVEFARRIVGDIEQRDIGGGGTGQGEHRSRDKGSELHSSITHGNLLVQVAASLTGGRTAGTASASKL